jgi:hypothetical protein
LAITDLMHLADEQDADSFLQLGGDGVEVETYGEYVARVGDWHYQAERAETPRDRRVGDEE